MLSAACCTALVLCGLSPRALIGPGQSSSRSPSLGKKALATKAVKIERLDDKVRDDAVPRVESEVFKTLDLRVSSPEILLNHIADRYSSTSRILMEFVDNALDDAEQFFDHDANAYQRPIKIEVAVNSKLASLTVTDNCGGMTAETLGRVTTNVGESQKRGQAFLNGQFGFGMQAFRACCSTLRVRSRSDPAGPLLEIAVHREQSGGIRLQEAAPDGYAAVPQTGTQVSLRGFDEQWATNEALSPVSVADEIEAHFERLLSRGNLTVMVRDETARATAGLRICQPQDYADRGAQVIIKETIDLGGEQWAEVLFAVAPQRVAETLSQARFFAKGRRIGNIASIGSFVKDSAHRWDVWSHPQLVGYMDILGSDTGALRPMITRDEFKNTRNRSAAYRQLSELCEDRLVAALEGANEARSMKSLQQLEDLLTQELHRVDKHEKREKRRKDRLSRQMTTDEPEDWDDELEGSLTDEPKSSLTEETELPEPEQSPEETELPEPEHTEDNEKEKVDEEEVPPVKPKGWGDFKVQLVEGLPGDESDAEGEEADLARTESKRSALVGSTIMVNVRHEDFQLRYRRTRSGTPKIDERLCSYLANIVSAHYRDIADQLSEDQGPKGRMEAFEGMIQTYCRYEKGLRRALPMLSRVGEAAADTD